MRIVKTNREVGASRILGDHYAIMTNLHKVQQQANHLRDVSHNEGHYFTPKLRIRCDQATLDEESIENVTDIPRREDREPPGLLKGDSL